MIKAHLNGGPLDDQYRVVERPILLVPIRRRFSFVRKDEDPMALDIRVGQYNMRLDSLGCPVPHDLAGVCEFDYVMP